MCEWISDRGDRSSTNPGWTDWVSFVVSLSNHERLLLTPHYRSEPSHPCFGLVRRRLVGQLSGEAFRGLAFANILAGVGQLPGEGFWALAFANELAGVGQLSGEAFRGLGFANILAGVGQLPGEGFWALANVLAGVGQLSGEGFRGWPLPIY